MKETKRKGFNFFRSYYDVYNELESDSDKVKFIEALFARQFHGTKPNDLKGMVRFAYVSQVNSIDTQVKGYEDKLISLNKDVPNFDPWQGVNEKVLTPTLQEKGKGQGKGQGEGKEQEEKKNVKYYRSFAHLKLTLKDFDNLLKSWSKEQIDEILDSIENFKKNTNYTSLNLTARKWLKKEYPNSENVPVKIPRHIYVNPSN